MFKRKKKFVNIRPNQVFLDGSDRFEPDKVYRVEINRARYFDRNGWLEGSLNLAPPEADLDIDNSILGHKGGL